MMIICIILNIYERKAPTTPKINPSIIMMTIQEIRMSRMMAMMMITMITMMVMMMMTLQDLVSEAESEAARKTAEIANKETRKKVPGHKSPLENKWNKTAKKDSFCLHIFLTPFSMFFVQCFSGRSLLC